MADKTIQSLDEADELVGTELFVLQQNGAKKIEAQDFVSYLATALEGHGGITDITYTAPEPPSLDGTLTITMADNSSYSFDDFATNGRGISNITWTTSGTAGDGMTHTGTVEYNDGTTSTIVFQDGVKGDQGQRTYVWIAWADDYPTSDSQVKFTVGPYIGFYSGTASTAPTAYTAYTWYEYKGDRGDTGDYIEPILSYGNSAAAGTEPFTWYSNPTSISYSAGNFIWRKTEYVLHDAQTVQATKTEIIGYIGQNGSGSGTVTHITFNGTVFQDDGTGNVSMTINADDVGAIANPTTKSNGQVLTYDSTADEWVAATPTTGDVNTVNNVGVTVGTTNIQLYASAIPMSSSDNRSVTAAIPSASNALPNSLGTPSAGSDTGFSRSDHVHKLPDATDILLTNGNSVQSTVEHLPMWRGKKALIIGDSWTAGWNGAATITPWTSTFLSMTGMTSTIIPQSSAGFTVGAGSSGATYPGETFVQVLEHVKTDSFDMIVVQGGVNDIVNSTGDISTALTAFKTNCGTYWPNAPVFFFITVPFYYLTGTLQTRAVTLVNTAAMLGYYIDSATAMLSKSGAEYKGTDRVHPSAYGQTLLGRMAANYVTGQNIDIVPSVVTYPTDSYAIKDFAFGSASSSDYYVRCLGKHITVYMVATINSTATGGFITIATGMPLSEASYTFLGTAVNRTDHTAAPVPVYINGENLIIQNFTNASLKNKSLLIAGSYTTKSL